MSREEIKQATDHTPNVKGFSDTEVGINISKSVVAWGDPELPCRPGYLGLLKVLRRLPKALRSAQEPEDALLLMKILDSDGMDLVFVDLPGLIPNSDDETLKHG
ncbi:hypothetical protein GSI_12347 [Ganoderma sinense ZZ0214-1]|uniref:Uncharacterized protein n=1 Tax=Ganoderma sinense ZZ0214-1 TaxID=1077348 RepID=A0A2G8RYI5_9APHY|nr:hypothetical protein GSI_12347 [Ganoderma sinense ZZ0214-1]